MSERVQVIFRWDRSKLEQLKAWAASERLTLQEVLESLAAKFLADPDSRKITEDNICISSLITRLEEVKKTVAVLPERVAALELKVGELSA